MSKRGRQERKEARRAMEQAAQDAAALNASSFNTAEEANAALADASRVINMKETQERRAAKTGKAGGAKAQRKSAAAGSGKLPAMPRARGAKKDRPLKPCECGCGGTTKSRFCPGHDSYLRGLCLRVHRQIMTLDDVAKLVGGEIGKAQRAAVERELKEMKKKGELTNKKVTEGAVKKTKEHTANAASKTQEKVTRASKPAKPEAVAEVKEERVERTVKEGVGA